jgi:hypothetical protein
MNLFAKRALLFVFAVAFSTPTLAQRLKEIEPYKAQQIAVKLVAQTQDLDSPQVKLSGDVSKATGLTISSDGMLAVPQKGLKEGEEMPDVRTEQGAPLAYLFMSENFHPVVAGQPLDADKVRTVTVTDDDGEERKITCLLLAVRMVGQDDWRLYAYGSGKQPAIDSSFSMSEIPSEQSAPVSLNIEDVSGYQGNLVVTVFGKYRAAIRVSYSGD